MLQEHAPAEMYAQLMQNCFHIFSWRYDCHLNVISSNCPYESLFHQLMLESGIEGVIKKHQAQTYSPFLYMCDSSLGWIVAFEKDFSQIHIKGPFFHTAKNPEFHNEMHLTAHFSAEAEHILTEAISSLPMLPANLASAFAIMLHFTLHSEVLTEKDIFIRSNKHEQNTEPDVLTDQLQLHSKKWELEDELTDKVRRGDTDIAKLLSKFMSPETKFPQKKQEVLDYAKQNINILLSLVSRAAVEGGLPRKTSFEICRQYRSKIFGCSSTQELSALGNEAVIEYIQRVNSMKKYRQYSKPIQLCCEYINHHPNEKITLSYLAQRMGYTSFHLSRKFKAEVGISLVDYIQDVKIDCACFLLRTQNGSVDDIAEKLHFSSASYFSTIFHKKTGLSPTEYRKHHQIV